MRRCTRCGVSKPLGQFYFNKHYWRHFAECRTCNNARRRPRRERLRGHDGRFLRRID